MDTIKKFLNYFTSKIYNISNNEGCILFSNCFLCGVEAENLCDISYHFYRFLTRFLRLNGTFRFTYLINDTHKPPVFHFLNDGVTCIEIV